MLAALKFALAANVCTVGFPTAGVARNIQEKGLFTANRCVDDE